MPSINFLLGRPEQDERSQRESSGEEHQKVDERKPQIKDVRPAFIDSYPRMYTLGKDGRYHGYSRRYPRRRPKGVGKLYRGDDDD